MGGAEQSDFQEEGDGSLLGECGEEKEAKEHSQGQVWASGRRSGEAQKQLQGSFRWQIGVRAKGFRGRKGALGQTSVQVPAPMFGFCDLTKSCDLSEPWVPYLQCGEGP